MLNKIALVLGGLFFTIVLAAAVGLGVWAYSLNIQLNQARSEYQSLKSSNEKLNNDYNDQYTDSAQTNADLTAANAEIANLQTQLKKAQTDNDAFKARITAIQAKVSILYSFEFGSRLAFEAKINASGDAELKTLWETYQKTKSKDDFYKFYDYIVQSVANTAGLGFYPNLIQDGTLIIECL